MAGHFSALTRQLTPQAAEKERTLPRPALPRSASSARHRRRPDRRLLRVVAVLSLLTVPAVVLTSPTAGSPAVAQTSSPLPFDMPSTSSLRSSPKKVFAHYVPSLPLSLDNQSPDTDYYARNYLKPDGEGGKHSAYGGYLRDRPLGRAPRAESNWRLLDMQSEVRSAISAGLDGFTVVIYQLPGDGNGAQWTNINLLMQAAHNVDPGFEIMLMPDMSSASGMKEKSVATLARYMAELGRYPSAYRVSDGRLVISPFTAEGHTVDWWRSFLSTMRNTYSTPVAFLTLFQNEQQWAETYDSISYGMSNWGNRNPAWNNPDTTTSTSPTGRVAKVHALGQKWMQPVSVQDERPREGIYDEAENTTNLRNTWAIATKTGAELVQLATWGDYPEGSVIAPTLMHGWTFLDISAYYLVKYKTGSAPTITRDTVYLTHRTHPDMAKPRYPQSKLMTLRGGSPSRDTVEALTFLRAPGTVSAKVVRSGTTVAAVTSPYRVTTSPYVQDLQYVGVSSGRSGTSGGTTAPAPAPSPSSSSTGAKVVSLAPVADTYANEGAADENYGQSSSMSSRGEPGATAYLKFSLPSPPAGTSLVGAQLRLRTTDLDVAGSGDSFAVETASNEWYAGGVTWNKRPPLTGTRLGTLSGHTARSTTYTTSLDAARVAGLGAGERSLALTSTGTNSLWLWTSDHAEPSYQPRLVLTYR